MPVPYKSKYAPRFPSLSDPLWISQTDLCCTLKTEGSSQWKWTKSVWHRQTHPSTRVRTFQPHNFVLRRWLWQFQSPSIPSNKMHLFWWLLSMPQLYPFPDDSGPFVWWYLPSCTWAPASPWECRSAAFCKRISANSDPSYRQSVYVICPKQCDQH